MSKQVIARGVSPYDWEMYDDYSLKAVCTKCGESEIIPADRAEKIRKKADWYKDYTCYKCWKQSKDAVSAVTTMEREDSIHWGQAYNAAHADVVAMGLTPDDKDYWSRLEAYQEMHYEFIKKQIADRQNKDAD
jgi:predicted RNA-binding Zn-ribbon protein involved in translation (DUF1610 family)